MKAALPKPPPSLKEKRRSEHGSQFNAFRFQPRPVAAALTFDPASSHRPCLPATSGSVSKYMDKSLNKMVFRVRGAVPSSNYIAPNAKISDLSLTGNFIYTILKHPRSKPLTFHLDFMTTHGHPFRFTVSTFFAGPPRLTGTSTLRIPYSCFSNPSDESWTVLAMDVRSIAKKFASEGFSNDAISHLKSAKMCSFMTLFGVFTSDYALNTPSLCKATNLTVAPEVFKWLPKAPKNVGGVEGLSGGPESPWRNKRKNGNKDGESQEENEENRTSMSLRLERQGADKLLSSSPSSPLRELKDVPILTSPPVPTRPKSRVVKGVPSITPNPLNSPLIPPRKVRAAKPSRIIGCGGKVKNLSWSNADQSLTFPCNNTIVTVNMPANSTGQPEEEISLPQTFITTGNPVSVVVVSPSSTLLAAASPRHLKIYQTDTSRLLANVSIFHSPPSTKLDDPETTLPPPPPPVAISFSIDESMLSLVHYDSQRRLCITIFSVKELLTELEQAIRSKTNPTLRKLIPIVAKQTSDFPISECKFTPYEPTKLVSCGKENVRFWRIKRNHLPGCPAILNEFARNTSFNDLAFESSYGMLDDTSTPKIVFAATSVGTLLQISYQTRNVLCVLKLHSGPINTLAVNEGYAVTGSDDNYLRLWPLDFSDFLLEAQHESPVTNISLSLDGLKLLVGTASGTIGVLDVVTQSYATVVRSHTRGAVSCLCNDTLASRSQFATVGEDQTIRVWSIINGRQKYEFLSPHDAPTSLTYHPSDQSLACGFESGLVRIFDVITTSTKYELEQHTGAVMRLLYTKDGSILYSAATDGHISMFDAKNEYMPMKTVACDIPVDCVKLCLSENGNFLAATGPEKRSITVYDSKTLVPIKKLTCRKGAGEDGAGGVFKDMFFLTPNSTSLVAFTDTKAAYFYQNGKTCYDTLPSGGVGVSCVAKSREQFAVSCGDSEDMTKNVVYLWKCARDEGGGTVIKETKRCVGQWGKLTCLDFSTDDKFLIGSDETGVVYVWNIVEGVDGKVGLESGKTLNFEEDPKESIKALSNPDLLRSPPIPPRPKKRESKGDATTLTVERVMSLVLGEMIKRKWINEADAITMRSTGFAENSLLLAAVEAFLVEEDFEELLDTFLVTSKHLGKGKERDDDDKEDEGEEEEDDDDGDRAEAPVAKYLSQDALIEFPSDAIVPVSAASPYSIKRAVGFGNKSIIWRQDAGALLLSNKNVVIEEDLERNKQIFAQHDLRSTVTDMDISENEEMLVTGATSSKGSVRVWKRGGEELVCDLVLTIFDADGVDFVCFCGEGDKFIAVVSGKALLLYDLKGRRVAGNAVTLKEIDCLIKANSGVRNGSNVTCEVLFLTGGDGGLLMWSEGADGNLAFVKTSVKSSEITSVCCSGSYIMTGSSKGRVEVYGVNDDKIVATWLAGCGKVTAIEGKNGGKVVIVAGEEIVSQWTAVDDGKYEKKAEIGVFGGLVGMQWDEEGEEGVVGTEFDGVKYVGFKGVDDGGLALIKDYDLGDRVAYSNDGNFMAVCFVDKGALVIFHTAGGMSEVGRVDIMGGRELECCSLCFGETEEIKSGGGIRLLIAASFSNFFVKVASLEVVGKNVKVTDFVANMQLGAGEDIGCGNIKVAFVDGNTHLATGGNNGELLLSPVVLEEDGKIILKQESFDLLEHQKKEGNFEGAVNWKWTDLVVHPDDSNIWACCKIIEGGGAQLFVFQNGANSHTVGVSKIFERSPMKLNPTTFLARFSLSNPGCIVCTLGQNGGQGSFVVTFDVRNQEPEVVSITHLDGIIISKLEISEAYIFAGSEDGAVFVFTEENCSPLQNVDLFEVEKKVGKEKSEKVNYDLAVNRVDSMMTVVGNGGIFQYGL